MKRNVPISSEKVIQKMERFLNKNGGYERLSPIELYAFRYAFGSMDININNPSIIERIGLNDILTTFNSSNYILLSDSNSYAMKRDESLTEICSKLNERMIFVEFFSGRKERYIGKIYVYIPSEEDTMLFINNMRYKNGEESFIIDLEKHDKSLFKYHLQDEKIVYALAELNFSKEFFSFTNLNIEGSTVTFHYVP